jgi:hypothetical protein
LSRAFQLLRQQRFSVFDWLIELKQIECAKDRTRERTVAADQFKNTVPVANDSPSSLARASLHFSLSVQPPLANRLP